jgi:hypothetical protein
MSSLVALIGFLILVIGLAVIISPSAFRRILLTFFRVLYSFGLPAVFARVVRVAYVCCSLCAARLP